ncbi:MAG: alkaline phosphatase family protein [Ktedonobacterales bacterium]
MLEASREVSRGPAWRDQCARRILMLGLCGLVLTLSACGGSTSMLPPASYTPHPHALPDFSHIFVIVMENREAGDIIGSPQAPYLNKLAETYGLADSSYAIAHPSLPNYLALLGGETFGIDSDCTTCYVQAPNLVDDLTAGHKSWGAYMESMPSPCFIGDSYPYAQKHDPFMYFDDIRNNPARCRQVVPLTGLENQLAAGRVPDFIWITPNMCSDMHDCSTTQGDSWLAEWVPRILASPAWKTGGVLFITFDEGTTDDGCCRYAGGGHIVTLVISPLGKPHYRSNIPYDHYSLLRTIADAWGMPELGHAADPATTPLVDFF